MSRILRAAVVFSVVATSLLAILGVSAVERRSSGLEGDYAFEIGVRDEAAWPSDGFASEIERVAERHDVVIVHLVWDEVDSVRRGTMYYVAAEGRSLPWSMQGGRYRSFAWDGELRVRPLNELDDRRRSGAYLVVGPYEDRSLVEADFRALGAEVTPFPEWSTKVDGVMVWFVTREPTVLLVVVFLGVLLVSAGVLLSARRSGIAELMGRSLVGLLVRDAVHLGWVGLRCTGAVVVCLALFMWWFNDLAWFGLLVEVWLALLAGLAVLMALAYVCCIVVVRSMPVISRVKGELRSVAPHGLLFGARVVAVVLAGTAVVGLLDKQAVVASLSGQHSLWAAARGTAVLSGPWADDLRDKELADQAIAGWLEARERSGKLLQVERGWIFDIAPTGAGLPLTTPLLRVNSTYLRSWPARDVEGRDIAPSGAEILLLMPERADVDLGGLVSRVRETTTFQLTLREKKPPVGAGAVPSQLPVRVVRVPTGLSWFTYSSNQDSSATVTDPVVVVAPASAPVQSSGEWASAMSRQTLFVPDGEEARRELQAANLMRFVASVDDVADRRDAAVVQEFGALQVARTTVLAIVAALIATGAGLALVHAQRHGARIFVQHVHGWGFWRRHRGLVAVDLLFTVLVVLWWWRSNLPPPPYVQGVTADPYAAVLRPPAPLWVGVMLPAGVVAITWVVLAWSSRRVVRQRAAR